MKEHARLLEKNGTAIDRLLPALPVVLLLEDLVLLLLAVKKIVEGECNLFCLDRRINYSNAFYTEMLATMESKTLETIFMFQV